MASLIDRIAQKQATLLVPAGQYLDGSRFSKMFHAPAADCLPEGSVGGRQQYICQTPQRNPAKRHNSPQKNIRLESQSVFSATQKT